MLTQPYAASAKTKTYSVPTGTILPFMGEDIPEGFLLCNGAWVSVEEYPDLFGVIGTWCEVSDDGSEFQLPDIRDRVLQGAGTNSPNVSVEAGLPNGYGRYDERDFTESGTTMVLGPSGVFVRTVAGGQDIGWLVAGTSYNGNSSVYSSTRHEIDLSAGNSVFGSSTTVQPAAIAAHFLMKY